MTEWTLETPVALFIFNRPSETARVIEQVATVEPSTLMVVADGPRPNSPEDVDLCNETQDLVQERIDWKCDVHWNTADENLGLKTRFVTGLEWIFKQKEEAIILEDDCVPNRSFFHFCSTMLDRYRDDKRIMDISGTNHLGKWKPESQDYHFALNGGIWGWATWRRAWEWYDPEMELWAQEEVRQRVRDVIADSRRADYIEYIFDKTYSGEYETWDYQWGFARLMNSAMSIVPAKNLVSNIGFGDRATNTFSGGSKWAELPQYQLDFPLNEPQCVAVDREYDKKFHRMRPISHRNRLLRASRELLEDLMSTRF